MSNTKFGVSAMACFKIMLITDTLTHRPTAKNVILKLSTPKQDFLDYTWVRKSKTAFVCGLVGHFPRFFDFSIMETMYPPDFAFMILQAKRFPS